MYFILVRLIYLILHLKGGFINEASHKANIEFSNEEIKVATYNSEWFG